MDIGRHGIAASSAVAAVIVVATVGFALYYYGTSPSAGGTSSSSSESTFPTSYSTTTFSPTCVWGPPSPDLPVNYTAFLYLYHSMGAYERIWFNTTSAQGPANATLTAAYWVQGVSVVNGTKLYKVLVNGTSGTFNGGATIWFAVNGTLMKAEFQGRNYTKADAQSLFVGTPFGLLTPIAYQLQAEELANVYTDPYYVRVLSANTSAVGTTPMNVTWYAANLVPFTVQRCGGGSQTFERFGIGIGHLASNGAPVLVSSDIQTAVPGIGPDVEVAVQLTMITPAI